LNDVFDSIARKRRNHLRAGFNAIAKDNWNTGMKQRILNKLTYSCFGRLKLAFNTWKYDTFQKLRVAIEQQKAKIIDTFVRNSMSPL
jgi:hypothetical protein